MSKKKVKAALDVFEPAGMIEALDDHSEVEEFVLDGLDSGDLVIDGVAFERKTPSDFASSMTGEDSRLRDQVERMVQEYDNVYVLIEGDIEDFEYLSHTNVEPQSLRGFAASIEARYDVGVKFCGRQEVLVDVAVRLARKHNESPSRELRVESSVEKNAPVVKRMVACIEGVGSDTADRIYEQYSTIPMLLDAIGNDDLDSVDGVGPKTAENIEKALTQ